MALLKQIFQMEKAKICCCVFGSKYIFFLISSNGVAEDEVKGKEKKTFFLKELTPCFLLLDTSRQVRGVPNRV